MKKSPERALITGATSGIGRATVELANSRAVQEHPGRLYNIHLRPR